MKEKGGLRRLRGPVLSFALPPLVLLFALSLSDGEFVNLGPDAELYLSVADNFLANGHFIQTARPIEGFVVPFGMPLILTVFRALRLSTAAIAVVQHAMIGGMCQLLYLMERNRFGWGGLAPLIFCKALFRVRLMPDNLFVEWYYLFLLCLILWILSREDWPLPKRLLWLNAAGFLAFSIRPVLALVWLPIVGYTVWCAAKKRFPLPWAVVLYGVLALALLGNAAVNRRECGHWVWMENYSGRDLYIANNPETLTEHYASSSAGRFVGEEFYTIEDDPALDQTEKNAAFAAAARRWIAGNPRQFLVNTGKKFARMFVIHWHAWTVLALGGGILALPGANRGRRRRWAAEIAVNLALAAASASALVMSRYTLPIWPLGALHLAGLTHAVLGWLRDREASMTAETAME